VTGHGIEAGRSNNAAWLRVCGWGFMLATDSDGDRYVYAFAGVGRWVLLTWGWAPFGFAIGRNGRYFWGM
jgi:hypothetical protein